MYWLYPCVCMLGGKFEVPFYVGVQVRGMLEEDHSEVVYDHDIHNRTRNLRCSKVFIHELVWILFRLY